MNQENEPNFIRLLRDGGQKINFDPSKKASIRASLESRLSSVHMKSSVKEIMFVHSSLFRFATSMAMILIVFVSVAGAAEGAVPGDTLYQFKKMVNDRVVGTYSKLSSGEESFHITMVERRLDEIKEVGLERLDDSLRENFAGEIAFHVDALSKNKDIQVEGLFKDERVIMSSLANDSVSEKVRTALIAFDDGTTIASGTLLAGRMDAKYDEKGVEPASEVSATMTLMAPTIKEALTYSVIINTSRFSKERLIEVLITGQNKSSENINLNSADSCLVSFAIDGHKYIEDGECKKNPFQMSVPPEGDVTWRSLIPTNDIKTGTYIATVSLGVFYEQEISVIIP